MTRVRAWTTKFGINRTDGANATLKMSNPQEMAAPRTRVTLFRGVHPFQSVGHVCLVHAVTYRRGREENREFYTENKSPRPSRLMFDGATSFEIRPHWHRQDQSNAIAARNDSETASQQLRDGERRGIWRQESAHTFVPVMRYTYGSRDHYAFCPSAPYARDFMRPAHTYSIRVHYATSSILVESVVQRHAAATKSCERDSVVRRHEYAAPYRDASPFDEYIIIYQTCSILLGQGCKVQIIKRSFKGGSNEHHSVLNAAITDDKE
ncbi:hypothetical protein DBV15_07236 [Temnothorax longispinosus]|uniref:Uncharacterized protein n=1 Tax=Temnothorax longispinosus TaxID=300112 RepID=A0A4V3S781_9HYME|nr:hypothetical protein DBV15_07236 [Temnothorax longispinosus]